MKFLANLVMNARNFLADSSSSGDFLSSEIGQGATDLTNTLMSTFTGVMKIVMPIVFAVVTAMGVFFAVKLGIAYAQTETADKREEAKKRLVGAVIGFGIGIVAAALMWWLFTSGIVANLFTKG